MHFDRRAGSVAVGVIATVVLAGAALGRHPQGNIGRVFPYAVAVGLVWVAVAAVSAGRRGALTTACAIAAPGLLAVAVYAFFIEPVRFAECGRLVEELSDRACLSHGPLTLVLAAAAGSLVATALLVATRRKAWWSGLQR